MKLSVTESDISLSDLSAAQSITETSVATNVVPEVALVWQNLTVKSNKKVLLDHVCGKINGGFWAIMGPSGSGKSTLLNTLACRLDKNMKVSGEIKLNGQDYTRTEVKWAGGYVMQDDVLNPYLTVYETLSFTAQLRMPPMTTPDEVDSACVRVMEQMGLTHVKDVIVGNPLVKGVSGGERKRLCVAMELITNPRLLFLDEPTSGLDSVAALMLITKLKEVAETCTVICTIHQPQNAIFDMFEKLILLKSGRIVYQGNGADALMHFTILGYPCPKYENPADHFLDIISPMGDNSPEEIDKLVDQTNITDEELKLNIEKKILPREIVSWPQQFYILFWRAAKEQWRKRNIVLIQAIQSVIMATFIGLVYLQMGHTQTFVNTRQAMLFFCCINQGVFGALITINSFPGERLLSLRERAAGTYYVSAYFFSKILVESITQMLTPILFSSIVYFLAGLQPLPGKFFLFLFFMLLCSFAATSIALAISTLARTTDFAVAILPFVLELARLFGGFFLSPKKLPLYYSWIDAVSYVKYAYVGISLNELTGLTYNCTPAQFIEQNGSLVCPVTSGEQVIKQLGLDYINIGGCIGCLLGYIILTRIIAFLGAKFITW